MQEDLKYIMENFGVKIALSDMSWEGAGSTIFVKNGTMCKVHIFLGSQATVVSAEYDSNRLQWDYAGRTICSDATEAIIVYARKVLGSV